MVGGIVALAALALLAWFLVKRRNKDEFDGDFDPARVGRGGRGELDLSGAEVTPFRTDNAAPPQMAQSVGGDSFTTAGLAGLGAGGAAVGAAAAGAHSQSSRSESEYPHTESSYNNLGMVQQPRYDTPSIHPPPTSTSHSGSAPSQPMSSKEREAYAQRYGNTDNPMFASGSARPLQLSSPADSEDATSQVLVHQDGGRIPQDEPVVPQEIPPTYDSISDRPTSPGSPSSHH